MQTNRPDFSRRHRRARFAAPGEGCLDLWITMPFSFIQQGCSDRYGERFHADLFSRKLPRVVFFSNPQALQVILTSDDSELFDSPGDLTKRATRTSHRKAICDGIEWRSPSADASIADLNLC
jgi:hypothetical protein